MQQKKEAPSEVRVVVEVDGHPIGVLNLDIDRLWPLINHSKADKLRVEWMDAAKFDSTMRAAVMKRLMSRLKARLYQGLGDEIVKAELEAESFRLKAEAAAQAFGKTSSEIEKLAAESNVTAADFYSFFREYLLDDREVTDLKKEWKTQSTRPR